MVLRKGKKCTKEQKEKISKSKKKFFSNPLARRRWSRLMRKRYKEHPQLAKQIDRVMTKWWCEHPNIKEKMSIRAKNLFINNPDKFKKFLKYGKNPALPRFKTKQGFLVRSRGEQQIANFLHTNKIQSQYEAKTLIFKKEGQVCVPDFWLPKYKMYIEYYGGYPKAWKKKVMKNRLYKKYKIPCIFITPSELRDLKYYLMGELGGSRKI
jgi:hypothetical protein